MKGLELILWMSRYLRLKSRMRISSQGVNNILLLKDILLNPLNPMSDQNRISPNNIHIMSSRQVMRIKRNINKGIIC